MKREPAAYSEGAEPVYAPQTEVTEQTGLPTVHTARIMQPGCRWRWNCKPVIMTVLTYLDTAAVIALLFL